MKAFLAWLITAAWTIVGTSIAIATKASGPAFFIILVGIPCCLTICIRASGSGAEAHDAAARAVTGSEVVFVFISTLVFMLMMFAMVMSQMGDWRL